MNQNKLLKFMDSMTNASENTVMQTFGNISHLFLTIFLLLQLLIAIFSAFMEVFHQVLTPLIKSSNLTELWKFHTKDQSAIFCGLTQMIDVDGVSVQEVQATRLDKISANSLTTQMIWSSSLEPINL